MVEVIKKTIEEKLTIPYDNVILFGSRARGQNRKESDYDILIVLKSEISNKEKIITATQIRKELARKKIDADILVKSRQDINYYKNKIGSIINRALKEGVIL